MHYYRSSSTLWPLMFFFNFSLLSFLYSLQYFPPYLLPFYILSYSPPVPLPLLSWFHIISSLHSSLCGLQVIYLFPSWVSSCCLIFFPSLFLHWQEKQIRSITPGGLLRRSSIAAGRISKQMDYTSSDISLAQKWAWLPQRQVIKPLRTLLDYNFSLASGW